jgi:type IV secretory pathway VirD2 relaxase
MTHDFTPKLGRIGWKQGTRLDRYINRVMRAAQAAGHVGKSGRSGFTGVRIGRGGTFGTLAGAGLFAGGQRRVIVKARITKLKRGDLGAARAHLRYIQRDGVTPDGEPGELYGRDTYEINGTQFLDACDGDRHQFRLIVSADDATELADLKPFIRDLMAKAESDLGTKLDWVAVDHFNTGHPHTHIVIRGKDDRGQDLIIARDYMSHGFRMRARELVTLELGPEIESDMTLKLAREVEAERFTRLDRALLTHAEDDYLVVSAMPPAERQTHAAHMGRLRTLERLELARERQTGVWQLMPDLEAKLRIIGTRGDIIKTMHRSMREIGVECASGNFAMFDPSKPNARIVGRVAGIGLTDEIDDRHYLVIDGIDGKVHYTNVGHLPPDRVPEKDRIVSIEAQAESKDNKARIRLRILSYISLEKLVTAEGATWLDKELLSRRPERLIDHGFGAEVQGASARRRQWLVSQGLARLTSDASFSPVPDMLPRLRQRDLQRAGAALSKELRLSYLEPRESDRISGMYERAVHLASGKFAVIQMSKEFVLAPWQQSFEKMKGQRIAGYRTCDGFEWDFSRNRKFGLGIS